MNFKSCGPSQLGETYRRMMVRTSRIRLQNAVETTTTPSSSIFGTGFITVQNARFMSPYSTCCVIR